MMDASAAVSVILGSSQLGTPPKKKPLLQTAGEMDPDRHSEWLGPAG